MEPVLTQAALNHLILIRVLWVRVGAVAGAVRPTEVMIVLVLRVLRELILKLGSSKLLNFAFINYEIRQYLHYGFKKKSRQTFRSLQEF